MNKPERHCRRHKQAAQIGVGQGSGQCTLRGTIFPEDIMAFLKGGYRTQGIPLTI